MKRLRSQEGFTLIELVVIILILGILAATAIPKFVDLQTKAKEAAEKGMVGGVRGGIATVYASNLVYNVTPVFPATLGGGADGILCSAAPCFGNVLDPPCEDAGWKVLVAAANTYVGPANTTYTYNPATGTFK